MKIACYACFETHEVERFTLWEGYEDKVIMECPWLTGLSDELAERPLVLEMFGIITSPGWDEWYKSLPEDRQGHIKGNITEVWAQQRARQKGEMAMLEAYHQHQAHLEEVEEEEEVQDTWPDQIM